MHNQQLRLEPALPRHFEKYYAEQGHDAIKESIGIVASLESGWEYVTEGYPRGKKIFNQWREDNRRKHPTYYLDEYTMKSYSGKWAFKEDDYGTPRPVRDVSPGRLNTMLELVRIIETSKKLTPDDVKRIKLIKNKASEAGPQKAN